LFGFVGIVFVVEMNVFFYNKKVSIFYVFCLVFMLVFVGGVLQGVVGFFVHILFFCFLFFVFPYT